jgi:hypothetical protein
MLHHTCSNCAVRGTPGRKTLLTVRASGSNGASIAEGAKVKVVKPVKVYHVPKKTDGFCLEGLEGTLVANVMEYKGKTLSANLPYRIQFQLEGDGPKPIKLFAHLVRACMDVNGGQVLCVSDFGNVSAGGG